MLYRHYFWCHNSMGVFLGLGRYLRWFAKEPRIIGVNPWHFDSWCPADHCLGAVAFPQLRQAVAAFGTSLRQPNTGAFPCNR